MEELVRKADVLQLLHEMGGCGAMSDSWADGWDKAIDEAYDKVEGMKPVEPLQLDKNEGMRRIVSAGIIPAIEQAITKENTVDSRIAEVGMLLNAYNDFYHTGRGKVEIPTTK